MMTTLTVEIDKERDLPALQALLIRMGLTYRLNDDEWGDLSDGEVDGITAGLADIEAGLTHTHAEVKAHINKKIDSLRGNNGK